MASAERRQAELDEALQLLHFAFRAVVAEPDRVLASGGLSRVHHRILYFVRRHAGISVNGLLAILGISKQALHQPLRALVRKKLIAMSSGVDDRRVKALHLTAEGAKLELTLSGDQRRRFEAVFRKVGREREEAWRETMRRLAE